MIPLFANRQRNGQPVAGGRKRASGVRRIGAWRIFQVVEVELQFAGLIYAVAWKCCGAS